MQFPWQWDSGKISTKLDGIWGMSVKTLLRYLSIVVLIVAVLGAALLFTPLGERPLTSLFAVGDVETVDFAELKLTDEPNWFLMCPPGFCGAKPHADSPVFDVSVERLRARRDPGAGPAPAPSAAAPR